MRMRSLYSVSRKKRILFLGLKPSSFVLQDVNILRSNFEVSPYYINKNQIKHSIISFFRSLIKIFNSDLVFTWFTLPQFFLHIIIAKMLHKKVAVVVGGYEVVKMEEINYGALNNPIKAFFIKKILNFADIILPVSNYVSQEVKKITRNKNIYVIHNGIDTKKFFKLPGVEKEELMLTVASDIDRQFYIKGIDIIFKIASHFQRYKILIIGKYSQLWKQNNSTTLPSNIEIVGFLKSDELLEFYSKAKIYLQLSRQESFGCALAEAMACECIPVVSNKTALPEVVGETGIIVNIDNEEDVIKGIKKALEAPSSLGKKARDRICKFFDVEKRKKELIKVISNLFAT